MFIKLVISVFVFAIVLFFYLHICFHLKKSNDLEVYEIMQPSKDKLEEICDLRQPVVFDAVNKGTDERSSDNNDAFQEGIALKRYFSYDYLLNQYPSFDVNIASVSVSSTAAAGQDSLQSFFPLKLGTAVHLFSSCSGGDSGCSGAGDNGSSEAATTDTEGKKHFSQNNQEFLNETGLIKQFRYNESLIKPYLLASTKYDLWMGSKNIRTPLQYELNYRTFFFVSEGEITIKLSPPMYTKYMNERKDYETLRFTSAIDLWNPSIDNAKIKSLEFKVGAGKMIYVPAYWWYTVRFDMEKTVLCQFQYRTYMNIMSIVPQLFLHILQIHNITQKRSTGTEKSEDNNRSIGGTTISASVMI